MCMNESGGKFRSTEGERVCACECVCECVWK